MMKPVYENEVRCSFRQCLNTDFLLGLARKSIHEKLNANIVACLALEKVK